MISGHDSKRVSIHRPVDLQKRTYWAVTARLENSPGSVHVLVLSCMHGNKDLEIFKEERSLLGRINLYCFLISSACNAKGI